MATMPSSGQISSANLVSVFGGSAPYSSADYYRGGGLVPSTKLAKEYGPWSAYQFNSGEFIPSPNPEYYLLQFTGPGPQFTYVYWDGEQVGSAPGLLTVVDVDNGSIGQQYEAGDYFGTANGDYYYWVRFRNYALTTQSINTSVPTSGQMSSDDFYSAENP